MTLVWIGSRSSGTIVSIFTHMSHKLQLATLFLHVGYLPLALLLPSSSEAPTRITLSTPLPTALPLFFAGSSLCLSHLLLRLLIYVAAIGPNTVYPSPFRPIWSKPRCGWSFVPPVRSISADAVSNDLPPVVTTPLFVPPDKSGLIFPENNHLPYHRPVHSQSYSFEHDHYSSG